VLPQSVGRRSDARALAAHHRDVRARGLVPFLDIAYQGFGDGVDADGTVVRMFAATPGPMLVSSSFSKSFSIYGERVGALSIVAADKDEATRVLSQVKRIIRANYSNPPTHGGQIVATVLCSPELRALWDAELAAMRDRIKLMRALLVERLHEQVPGSDFRFILNQRGMFSYSGLTKPQVHALREHTRFTRSTPGGFASPRSTGKMWSASLPQSRRSWVNRAVF
jgi:aromatic-amino-acid transaminase